MRPAVPAGANREFKMPKTGKSRILSYTTNSSLLRSVQSGNDAAWTKFYQKYSRMIQYIGKSRGLSPEECDDLMVEVMTVFWKKMETFVYDRRRGRFRSYLGRIADFCAMRHFARKRSDSMLLLDENLDYPADVDTRIMDEWRDYILERALEELRQTVDTETYQVFYMSFVQKCSVEKISAVTRKTANNIYVIRSRCFAKLTRFIAELRQLDEGTSGPHSHKKR